MQQVESHLPYPWFERAAYEKALEVMEDRDYWPKDYDTWHGLAKNAMARLSTDGVQALREPIDPEVFRAWCRAHDRPSDSASRLAFAQLQWQERGRG